MLATVTMDAPTRDALNGDALNGDALNGDALNGDDGAHKPVVCRQGPVIVTSFHPELAGDPRLHEFFLQSVRLGHPKPIDKEGPMRRKENVRAL